MNVPNRTCILLKRPTYNRLRGVKNQKDTFDDVINNLLQTKIEKEVLGQGATRPAPHGTNGAINPGTGYDYRVRCTRKL